MSCGFDCNSGQHCECEAQAEYLEEVAYIDRLRKRVGANAFTGNGDYILTEGELVQMFFIAFTEPEFGRYGYSRELADAKAKLAEWDAFAARLREAMATQETL